MSVAFRTCPLCEATCGLEIEVQDGAVRRIRGDRDDVFSKGFICPKGSTLKQLHEDPDRVRTPLIKRDGRFEPATWDEAFAEIERRLLPVIEAHGRDAVAVYIGNPNAHNLSGLLYNKMVIKALGTSNIYSASTVDQRPKEISAALMFGTPVSWPVPDLDRTDHVVMLGANPFASNGSLATAPDWPGRLRAIRERGGKVVVIDPKRTKTAEEADEHHSIRPGTDAQLLMAIVHTLFEENLVDLGTAAEYVVGVDEVERAAKDFAPETVAALCGIDAPTIRRLAREIAAAPAAAVYGRIGTCTQEFGTLASWLVDVVNALTGNLDKPGGAMWAKAAAGGTTTRGAPRYGRTTRLGRRQSRVRGLPESLGEFPVVALAEEIDTPGDGQVRAMVTMGGNPVLSTPNGGRLDKAMAGLDFMVSVDIYVNETTRHADVILPAPSALSKGHYDIAFYQFSLRNVANYSPPVFELGPDELDEWKVACKLALIVQGQGVDADPAIVDDMMISSMVRHAVSDEHSPVFGEDPDKLLAEVSVRNGPERIIDFMLRTGPYDLTLDDLLENPHGVDLGPLQPRLPEVLRTESGMIELAPEPFLDDVPRLRASLDRALDPSSFVLIGRRHLRSNNSWMHNVGVLVKGKPQCTAQLHPSDASRLGLADGALARLTSRTGMIDVPVEITDAIRPGVVSVPHGWGHNMPGVEMAVAEAHAGANSNVLADDELFDVLSGNAVLNGIPVTVAPV